MGGPPERSESGYRSEQNDQASTKVSLDDARLYRAPTGRAPHDDNPRESSHEIGVDGCGATRAPASLPVEGDESSDGRASTS